MEITSYDVKKVNVSVNGSIITGFAADSLVNISKNEDAVTTAVGCQGDVVYEENANESGTIQLTLVGTSSSISKFRSWAASRKEVTVMVSDSNDYDSIKVSAQRCRVLKVPDVARGKNAGSVQVNIFVPNLQIR